MSGRRRRVWSGRGRHRRRLLTLALVLVVGLVAGWAGWHALLGAGDLRGAERQLAAARADAAGGTLDVGRLRAAADRTEPARRHLDDRVLRVLQAVPLVGPPLESAAALARAADLTVREALLPLATQAGPSPTQALTAGPGALDLTYLARMAPPSREAAATLARASAAVDGAPAATGVSVLDRARGDFAAELTGLRAVVDDVALVTDLAPRLLGRDRPQRYLVVSQSPAEARGTGGLIGGYSLLEASDGVLRVLDSGSRRKLVEPGRRVLDLGPEYTAHYGQDNPASGWINSNLSPHFPYAAQIWAELWQRQTGERLDGFLAVDPVALSYLLQATGPVTVPDAGEVTASNVVDLTLREVYARYDDDLRRDAFLQRISNGVATALTRRELPGRTLLSSLARAVGERRLLLWSGDPAVQARLAGEPVSGTLPTGRAVGDVIVDLAGSKLDVYLDRALAYTAGCDGPSTLSLTLSNTAPPSGLPAYVTPAPFRRGEPAGTNILRATLYLPKDSLLRGLSLGGAPVPFRQGTERGLEWLEVEVTLRPGERTELVATFDELAGTTQPLQRIAQPLVRPERFRSTLCG